MADRAKRGTVIAAANCPSREEYLGIHPAQGCATGRRSRLPQDPKKFAVGTGTGQRIKVELTAHVFASLLALVLKKALEGRITALGTRAPGPTGSGGSLHGR
jgi:hypothetical protein